MTIVRELVAKVMLKFTPVKVLQDVEIINGTPDYHSGAAGRFLGATWTLTYVKTTAKSSVRSSGLLWWEKHSYLPAKSSVRLAGGSVVST